MPPFLLPLLTWAALLLRYPRRTLAAAVPVLLVILALAIRVQWQEKTNEQLLDQLDISLSYAPAQCPADRPLRVQLHNSSQRPLHSLQWRIAAYRPGERTNLVEERFNSPAYTGASPLAPGQQWQQCLPLPELRRGYQASSLEFRIERRQGRFQ